MSMAYVGTRSVPDQCNLGTVRDLLMTAEPEALWLAMARNDAFRGLIRKFGESNENRHKDELNSTMEIARTAMKWLDSEPMEDFVSDSSFSMRDLKEGETSIYIVLPAGMGDTYKAWLRLLFNAAFEVMQDTKIPKPDDSVRFVMDEFPLLGRMDRIKRAAGEAAKFGIKLFICAQDISQLKENYGEAWETFIANSGLLIMFANNDLETQHYLSNRLGKEKYRKVSYTSSFQGGSSTSSSTELQDVARADQVAKQVSRQAGDAFFFIAGHKPLRLPRANYDQWPVFQNAIVEADHIARRKSEISQTSDMEPETLVAAE
ncbi:MAG: type IV secretory system conjugative DNA transfer family protein [Pseudomonadota bacterium]